MTINQDELIAGISNKSLLIFSAMLLGCYLMQAFF